MAANQPKKDDPNAYKNAVAKARRLKRLRKMKLKDRAGDVEVSDISDVEVVAEVDEEPQDAWLNDLLKADGDGVSKNPAQLASMETTNEPEDQPTFSSKFCAFTNENSTLLGIGIATLAITIIAKLRK